ncbi:MAG: 23S rRNA (pseudouridine(1915)-N(3))-methyltransferase RlmH [Bdellovibrionales bacterium]
MDITILACGKMKKEAYSELLDHYQKQFKWKVSVKEINVSQNDPAAKKREENKQLISFLEPDSYVIALDETGKDLSSREISQIFDKQQQISTKKIQIIIGGSDGLERELLAKASTVLRFGKQTWPHKMVRLMLFEQLYRVQSILDGHPYHRD